MLMISGVDVVVIALARFLLGGDGGWLAAQMGHPEWFGLTFYDTIFPTFLFISGISFPFSCAKQLAHGRTKAQVLLRCLKRADASGARKTCRLLALAAGLLVSGLAMTHFVPVSKKLWSPSFSLIVGAYSTAMFAAFYYVLDVRQWRGWAFPLSVVGLNPVTIYVLKSFAEYHVVQKWVFGSTVPVGANVLLASAYLAACWGVTYALWR